MTETKNVDHVAIKQEVSCSWSFVVPSDGTSCTEAVDELSEILSRLFSSLDGFVIPIEATFKRQEFPAGSPIPASESGDPDERQALRDVTVSAEDGIRADDIVDSIRMDGPHDPYVFEVAIDRAKVKIRLHSGDSYVDRHHGSEWYNLDTPLDRTPGYDPLYFVISHLPNVDDEDLDSDFQFVVRVKTKADIWFEESDIGRTNRDRLRAFLGRIDEGLPVTKLVRGTDWNSTDPLEEIY